MFCKGDNNAIVKQYKQWLPELFLIAFRYLKSQEEAEDVVADCFEKLLKLSIEKRKQKFIIDQIDLKALLIVVVKNKCLDNIKIKKNRIRIIDNIKSMWSTTDSNASKKTFTNENFETLIFCFPEKERAILKLNLEGYKHNEISQRLNISEKTVSNSLSISRSKIKNIWSHFMD